MINIRNAEGAYAGAQARFNRIMQRVSENFYFPVARMQIARMLAVQPKDVIDGIPKETLDALLEKFDLDLTVLRKDQEVENAAPPLP